MCFKAIDDFIGVAIFQTFQQQNDNGQFIEAEKRMAANVFLF